MQSASQENMHNNFMQIANHVYKKSFLKLKNKSSLYLTKMNNYNNYITLQSNHIMLIINFRNVQLISIAKEKHIRNP